MFVIELIYKADLAEIDANMRAHMAFLKRHYAAGHFLLSGRKIPREGGIILAVGESREQVEAIVKEDPFVSRGLADYRLIEFRESQRADSIDALLGPRLDVWIKRISDDQVKCAGLVTKRETIAFDRLGKRQYGEVWLELKQVFAIEYPMSR